MIKKILSFITAKLDASYSSSTPKELLENHIKDTFGDQKGQVDYLINYVLDYENNGLFKKGFFIDLACAEGVHWNNTYFLEKYLGWDGILFEPNPKYEDDIRINRKSKLVTKVVHEYSGTEVPFRIDNGMLGGIVSNDTDNNEQIRGKELEKAEIINIKTTTLEKELESINAPPLIDFMSLDVEGAEWIVMKNFPFNKYKIRCMAIERPNKKLDILLESEGYRQVVHLMYDVIYVHKDFLRSVNFNPSIKFAFTPRKDW